MSIEEATAIAQLSDCESIAKALFIEIINLHADQRRDWGDEQTIGSAMHFLLLRKLGIHAFTDKELTETYKIVKANSPGKTEQEIQNDCRFVAYNHFIDYLVKSAARLDENGKMVFNTVVTTYVSPYKTGEIVPNE